MSDEFKRNTLLSVIIVKQLPVFVTSLLDSSFKALSAMQTRGRES